MLKPYIKGILYHVDLVSHAIGALACDRTPGAPGSYLFVFFNWKMEIVKKYGFRKKEKVRFNRTCTTKG